jgi:predicted dehydrogenase
MTNELNPSNQETHPSRRAFMATTGGLALNFMIVPRHVLGGAGYIAPSEQINVGGIGAGGMGGGDIATVARLGANIVALCDVDDQRAAGSFNAFPKARRYKDFREMIDKEAKHLDAVTVGTPDHIHAVASMAAIKAGKHVYCQKPLTHTLHECRELTRAAHAAGVATQMGNQGHATEGARLTNEWIQAGVIGSVDEVHVWSDRAGRLWKQGIGRPTETPPVPSTLDWKLWLGPVRERPYSPAYAPVSWRGWWDFGTGAMGDMGCHIIDHPVWALRLGPPSVVEARTTLDGAFFDGDKPNTETYPIAAMIYYEFPARGDLPAVRMTWYDGGLMPPAPAELDKDERLPDNGVLYIGSKGKMFHSSHGGMPQLLPRGLHDEAAKVGKSIERSPGHYEEWVAACKGGPRPVSNFDYAGPLTEIMLLGVLSLKTPGRRLEWDTENLKIKNAPDLNHLVHIEYRKGWML